MPNRKLTKKELEKELRKQKQKYIELMNEKSTSYFRELHDSDADSDLKRLSAKIIDLRKDLELTEDERNEYKAESKEWKRKYFSLQIKEKIDKDTGEIHF